MLGLHSQLLCHQTKREVAVKDPLLLFRRNQRHVLARPRVTGFGAGDHAFPKQKADSRAVDMQPLSQIVAAQANQRRGFESLRNFGQVQMQRCQTMNATQPPELLPNYWTLSRAI